ncbi:MAG: family 16 glycoside hydrolase, partial [Vicinamibacterales bacterium]
MRTQRLVLLAAGIVALVVFRLSVVGTAQTAQDLKFVSLFNGKDLTGWKIPAGDNGHWKVVDGVIDYVAASEAS